MPRNLRKGAAIAHLWFVTIHPFHDGKRPLTRADEAGNGRASYTQFEGILTKLHAAGFFPLMSDLSAVAKTMV